MKKSIKKLVLSRETLRTLDDSGLKAWGGIAYGATRYRCEVPQSQDVSICVGCTGPLDGCPPDTNA